MRIVWAADPFSAEKDILKSAAWSIRALAKAKSSEVEPVYVLTSDPVESRFAEDPGYVALLEKEGRSELEGIVRRIKIRGLNPLRVIAGSSATIREGARDLIRHAKAFKADLIVVSSHGRKGIKRWLLGSFAETLALYSDVPLLIVHPNWKRTPDFKSILFATDFSEESLQAFQKVLDFAELHGSRIKLFYKAMPYIYPPLDYSFGGYGAFETVLQDQVAENQKIADRLREEAAKRGVSVEVVFDHSRRGTVAEAILNRVRKGEADLVALASCSGPVLTVLMGSTTRQVVRYSEQPVWVIHPARKRAKGGSKARPLYEPSQADIDHDLIEHGKKKAA